MRAHRFARAALCLIAALALLAAPGLMGCASHPGCSVALVVERQEGCYWENLIEGARLAAEDNGWSLTVTLYDEAAGLDAALQPLRADYVALALHPEHLPERWTGDVPLIALGSPLPGATVSVTGEESTIGKRTGQLCAQRVGLQRQVALVTSYAAPTADPWETALRAELGQQGSLICARFSRVEDEEEAYAHCHRLLREEARVDAILCRDEAGARGALRAVRALGLRTPVVAADFGDDIALGLRDGIVPFAVVRSAYAYGYMGVEAAARLNDGRSAEAHKQLDAVYVDAHNMFDEELQAFLYEIQ